MQEEVATNHGRPQKLSESANAMLCGVYTTKLYLIICSMESNETTTHPQISMIKLSKANLEMNPAGETCFNLFYNSNHHYRGL